MSCRKAVLVLLAIFVALLVGCSTSTVLTRYARAEQLERESRFDSALHLYETVLPEIPRQDGRWRSQTYYHLGECLYRLNRPTEAYGAYERAADADPSNQLAQLRLGEMLLAAGAIDKATEQAAKVLKSAADDTQALALLGAAAAASGNNVVAEAAFVRVLENDPTRLTIALALADIYNRSDRVTEARAVLEKAAAAQPASASPWLALGRLEEQEGRAGSAEQAYRRAVALQDTPENNLRLAQFLERAARIPEAEQTLRQVDALRPNLPTALPDFQVISGRAPNALDQYLAALRVSGPERQKPGLADVGSNVNQERAALAARLIEAEIAEARAKNDSQGIEGARGHLEEYRQHMDVATIGILNAELALAKTDLPMAALYATGAVALAPQSAAAHYVLGVAKYRAGDEGTAVTEWEAALDGDLHFVPARLALAAHVFQSGDFKNAETYIVPAVQDEPANLAALNLFARVLASQGRYGSATVIARRALAIDNTAAPPHLVLGEVALQQHRVGEALLQFEQAVLLEPHSHDAIEGLTQVYRHGKISQDMLRKMEKVSAADPPSPTLMEITGRLYADRGWLVDAERCFKAALQLDPQRASAADALARTQVRAGQYAAAVDSATRLGGNSGALIQAFQAEQRNDLGAAIRQYESAVRQGDRSGTAANNLAWLYAQRGTDLERALSLAKSALALNPANPAVLDTLGVVHLRRREYSQAVRVLENAQRLAAGQPDVPARQQLANAIRLHLSEAYLRSGQTDDAAALR